MHHNRKPALLPPTAGGSVASIRVQQGSDEFDCDSLGKSCERRDVCLIAGQHDAVGFRKRDNECVNCRTALGPPS